MLFPYFPFFSLKLWPPTFHSFSSKLSYSDRCLSLKICRLSLDMIKSSTKNSGSPDKYYYFILHV